MATFNPYIKNTGEVIMTYEYPVGVVTGYSIPSDYLIYYPLVKNPNGAGFSYEQGTSSSVKIFTKTYELNYPLYVKPEIETDIVQYVDGPLGNASGGTYVRVGTTAADDGQSGKTWYWTPATEKNAAFALWARTDYIRTWGFGVYEKTINSTENKFSSACHMGVRFHDQQLIFTRLWQLGFVTIDLTGYTNWNHIVFTRDDNYEYFYLNGVEVVKQTYAWIDESYTWPVGVTFTGYNGVYMGCDASFAHAIIYDRHLTPTDVQNLYNSVTL
jgi:hypothetical protein